MIEPIAPTGDPSLPLEVHDLTVAYESEPVLWNIDFQVPEGKLVAVVGPNGAGKTTLLKTVLNIVEPASGWVKIYGESYTDQRERVGYVPQRESVDWDFPTTVLDLVQMGRYGHAGFLGWLSDEDRKIARDCLEEVGMEEHADRQINQLSGGQKQRAFLARALAQEADIYLMDEPFVGVDATTERSIVQILKQLREKGSTVILVHHDLQTLTEYFDWVVLLNIRQVAVGPIDDVLTEEKLRETYGGQLTVLTKAAQRLDETQSR